MKRNWGFLVSLSASLLTILLGLFLLFHQLIFSLPNRSIILSDSFDTSLIYWIANWGYHIVFEAGNPAAFFNANSFYPQQNTLAYSDSLLGMQVFFSPLRLLGVAPLPAIYFSLALTVLAAGLLSFLALRRIEPFSPLEISFILYGTFFSLTVSNYLASPRIPSGIKFLPSHPVLGKPPTFPVMFCCYPGWPFSCKRYG